MYICILTFAGIWSYAQTHKGLYHVF